MKKLVSRLFLLALLVIMGVSAILWVSPRSKDNFFAAAKDKQALLSSVPSPRIILVGGSNLAFSVDSEKIERQFKLPVINMGLNAGLGLRFMVHEIKPFLKDGDIVLLILEYEHFTKKQDIEGTPLVLGTTIKLCPECIIGIGSPQQMANTGIGIFQKAESDFLRIFKGKEEPEPIYNREGFNQYGDLTTHLGKPTENPAFQDLKNITLSSQNDSVIFLNSFYQSIGQSKIKIYFLFPGISTYTENPEQQSEVFSAYNKQLMSDLQIPILGTPQDAIYPPSFFFDTIYHMNAQGRAENTNRILKLLESVFHKANQ